MLLNDYMIYLRLLLQKKINLIFLNFKYLFLAFYIVNDKKEYEYIILVRKKTQIKFVVTGAFIFIKQKRNFVTSNLYLKKV